MIVNEATKIRVIRAFLGMDCQSFAARMGICADSVTNWEKGRTCPTPSKRDELMRLCQQNGIAFSPSGYPFPVTDTVVFKGEKSE